MLHHNVVYHPYHSIFLDQNTMEKKQPITATISTKVRDGKKDNSYLTQTNICSRMRFSLLTPYSPSYVKYSEKLKRWCHILRQHIHKKECIAISLILLSIIPKERFKQDWNKKCGCKEKLPLHEDSQLSRTACAKRCIHILWFFLFKTALSNAQSKLILPQVDPILSRMFE